MFDLIKKIFPIEFSKRLTVFVSIVWFLTIVVTFILRIAFGVDTTSVLNYVQTVFLTMMGGYIIKSGAENVVKINNNNGNDNNV